MAVPNTTTFSLQDVCDAISGTQDDLIECFAEANSTAFNSTYGSISDNNLLAFRDYNETVTTPTMSVTPAVLSPYVASGGSQNVSVSSNTTWVVSSKPTWITISGASGSGSDPLVTLTASNNITGVVRNGTVTFRTTTGSPIASDTVTVSQESGLE